MTELPPDPFPEDVPEELRHLSEEWQVGAQEVQRAMRDLHALVGTDSFAALWRGAFALDELRARLALTFAVHAIERAKRDPADFERWNSLD